VPHEESGDRTCSSPVWVPRVGIVLCTALRFGHSCLQESLENIDRVAPLWWDLSLNVAGTL
jgi:hypothetical protein